jgi:hypothetical protein
MIKIAGTLALWLLGLAFAFTGFHIYEPYLAFLHGAGVAVFLIAGFAIGVFPDLAGALARK